jgi:hypothetical protein
MAAFQMAALHRNTFKPLDENIRGRESRNKKNASVMDKPDSVVLR